MSETLVPTELVSELLCLYPESERRIQDLAYGGGTLIATVVPHTPEYTHIDVEYLTLTQLTLVVSQMAYVLGGLLFRDDSFAATLPLDGYSKYLERLRAGEVHYRSAHFKFRQPVTNRQPQSARLSARRVRLLGGRAVSPMLFSCANDSIAAEVTTTAQLVTE